MQNYFFFLATKSRRHNFFVILRVFVSSWLLQKRLVEQAPDSPINANKSLRFLDGSLGRQELGAIYQNRLGRSGAVRFGQEQGGHGLHIREFAPACHGNSLLEIQ